MSSLETQFLTPNSALKKPADAGKIILETAEDLRGYKKWKDSVPEDFRFLVEGNLKGVEARVTKEATPLVGQFFNAAAKMTKDPEMPVDDFDCDPRVRSQLEYLKEIKITDDAGELKEIVNVFSVLVDKKIGFNIKADYFLKKILPSLNWLKKEDEKKREEYLKQESKIATAPEATEEEYEPHRSPSEDQEGEPQSAIALVYPFFGGYYKDGVFTHFDAKTLKWKKSKTNLEKLPKQKIDEEKKRIYRSSVAKNGTAVIKLPYGWGVDQSSLIWTNGKTENFNFYRDQNGVVYLRAESESKLDFQVAIGPTKNTLKRGEPEKNKEATANLPAELEKKIKEIMAAGKLEKIAKARKIVSFIRGSLKYDKDDFGLEAIYKADPAEYFLKIWEHKKAKCDEANTLAACALEKYGFDALFISGHSAQSKSKAGEAMLTDSNRHACLEVFDEQEKKWIRLDATPKGDPNVDEKEQEEDLGEGDFGEQDAEIMSDEELENFLKKLEEKEKKDSIDPEVIFAREAECSLEEARRVLDKIKTLREKYKKEMNGAADYWKRVLRKNLKEEIEYTGPVRLSEGDELEDPVAARLDILAKESDPTGFEKEYQETKEEKIFSGYEVYIAADLSESMNDYLNGVKKADSQRDMVFLFIDNIMASAAMSRKAARNLKSPMPVKVSLTVFGSKNEIVLPLTENWGPAEQIKVYRALDSGAGSSTPDHLALAAILKQIEAAEKAELTPRMRRFVVVAADGGSDDPKEVKKMNEEFKTKDVPVDLFLIGEKKDSNLLITARTVYHSATPVPNPKELAAAGLDTLTKRIKEAYEI
jgi:hypothetical protein